MGHHRAQAQFDRARWRLKILVPIWASQTVLAIALVSLFGWRLSETMDTWEDEEKKGNFPTVKVLWESTNIGLAVLTLLLTSYEVFRFFRETLTPWTMLFSHALKLTSSLGVLALDVVVFIKQRDGHYSLASLILDSLFVVASLIPCIYSIRSYHRLSAYDELIHPTNTKPYGFGADPETYPSRFSMMSQNSRNSVAGAPADSQTNPERRKSSASTLSMLSMRSTPTPTQSTQEVPLQPIDRSASGRSASVYNHERDTQFDDYVSKRNSAQLKDQVERALGAEFGWVGSPGGVSAEELARHASVVGAGSVGAGRGVGVGRAPSYEKRVLGAVEEVMEEEGPAGGRGVEESDREALLGSQEKEAVEAYRDEDRREAVGGRKQKGEP